MSTCPLCGRPKSPNKPFCDYCSSMLCEICNKKLSRGYCAVCGRLVCEDDSELVGFARVCKDCLRQDPNLADYEYLKNFIRFKARSSVWEQIELSSVISAGKEVFNHDKVYLHVGIDDTDSPYGMCTTYLGALIYEKLLSFGEPIDYPLLIRLNPNIPVKTRGNGSIAIRFLVDFSDINNIRDLVINLVEKSSHSFFRKTKPAVAIYITKDYAIDKRLFEIYLNSLRDVTPLSFLEKKLSNLSYGYLEILAVNKKARGIIGAVSAIGSILKDYTYELLVYRKMENIGKEREISFKSVLDMEMKYWRYTFDNIDNKRLLIAPVGPDPVLLGIRGDIPEKLLEAFKLIEHEPFSLWAIFRSNQWTHSHVTKIDSPSNARPYQTVMMKARVIKVERHGEKVILELESDGWRIIGRIYKMQRELQKHALELRHGDEILLVSSVFSREKENYLIVNVEEFITLELVPDISEGNPFCPYCGSRLKKKDKNTYICRKCHRKIRYPYKLVIIRPRKSLVEKKRYESPPRAHRHLTLPTKRIFFRAMKISNLMKPYLIHPVVGRNKDIEAQYVKMIKEIKIVY